MGLDISAEMVAIARDRDPEGDYRVIEDGDFSSLDQHEFDLVQSAFTGFCPAEMIFRKLGIGKGGGACCQ